MANERPLWTPSAERAASSRMAAFGRWLGERSGRAFDDYDSLHAYSTAEIGAFWSAIWDYCGIIGEKGAVAATELDRMPGARFFPQARLNFAENLLKHSGAGTAIVFRGEDKVERRLSRDELRALVSRMQQAMAAMGIGAGDRVAAMLPNMPEAVAAMLAASSLGAIWSSCSPDFGERGVLDRFGQIAPKLFIACDGYWYNGKRIDVADKVGAIVPHLNAERTVIVPYAGGGSAIADAAPSAVVLDDFLAPYAPGALTFARGGFADPLYILFSSGTTGVPKCIVHSQGGTLIKHL